MTRPTQPLDGVQVLDLTPLPPGGYCTVMLADLGADVWRVVPPAGERYGLSVALGRGKRSVAVDLRAPEGQVVLRRLTAWADVVVEAERPGAMSARGFGYPEAAELDDRIIWCSITGFGQTGPLAASPGHDLSYLAHSGLLAAIGPELPWYPQSILAIPAGGLAAALAIVAALRERDRTGVGCQIDVSISEAATWFLSGSDSNFNGAHGQIPIGPDRYQYQCADGAWLAVASSEPRTWDALCTGLGLEDLLGTVHRWPDVGAVIDRLRAAFAARPAAEWVAELGALGAAVVVVNRGDQLRDDPHVVARNSLPTVVDVVVPRSPIRFRDSQGERPIAATRGVPVPAGDTSAVLLAAGYTAEEIADLRAAGVVGGT